MKAYQRIVRETAAPEPDEDIKRQLAQGFTHASVREVDYATAKELILKCEWLHTMGSTRWSFGIFFGEYLGGVCCYGSTVGTRVAESIAGIENADRVCTLVRGGCLAWTPTGSASYLISRACRMMADLHEKNIFIAYGTEEAGEIGQIYSSLNWTYIGKSQPSQQFILDGKIRDTKQVSNLARDRNAYKKGEPTKFRRSRAEQKQLLLEQGALFVPGFAKHRYVGIYGAPANVKRLKAAMKFPSLPFPRREVEVERSKVSAADLQQSDCPTHGAVRL